MTAYNGNTYAYNAAGDLLTKTVTATSAVTTYDYDVFGNLRSVALPTKTISYAHDALNRRVTRKDGSAVTARYLYDNRRLIAELAPAGTIAKRYVYSTRSNVPDYVVIGSDTYRLISDQVGTVRLVINATTGAIAQQIEYDEFGRVLNDTSPGFQNFGFAGGMYDPDTKLVRFGARWYDAEVGRWLSKDPILFAGGDSNLYGYVTQDPVNFFDSKGTGPISGGICSAFAAGMFARDWKRTSEISARRDKTFKLLESINKKIQTEQQNECSTIDRLTELYDMKEKWSRVYEQESSELGDAANSIADYSEYAALCGALGVSPLSFKRNGSIL